MKAKSTCAPTFLFCLAACNSQTPIGVVELDASDLPDGSLETALVMKVDTRESADVFTKPPPSGPPNQSLATLNSDGTYSCSKVVGNQYEGCPTQVLQGDMPCDLPAGTVCDIPSPDLSNYTVCTCNPAGKTNVFSCYGIGGVRSDCPREIPVHGSPCTAAQRGLGCNHYLKPLECTCAGDLPNNGKERLVGCTCDNMTQTWKCKHEAGSDKEPFNQAACHKQPPVLPPGPPLDPVKKLSTLSAEEVSTFCAWAIETHRAGGSPPLPEPVAVNGNWGDGFGARLCRSPVNLCLPQIPINICKRLMTRKPCGVTVKEMTDCFFTPLHDCQVIGKGCAPLNADPNCSETIVQLASSVRPADVEACAVPLN